MKSDRLRGNKGLDASDDRGIYTPTGSWRRCQTVNVQKVKKKKSETHATEALLGV